jgi:hypothetical protein
MKAACNPHDAHGYRAEIAASGAVHFKTEIVAKGNNAGICGFRIDAARRTQSHCGSVVGTW